MPPARDCIGLTLSKRSAIVPKPYKQHGVYMMRARMNYSRAERKTMIVTALAIEIQHRRSGTLSAYAIAKKLGMTPGTHIHSILREMAEDGELDAEKRSNPGRWQTVFYSLPKGTYLTPPRKRNVDVKINGQLVGQLEMTL